MASKRRLYQPAQSAYRSRDLFTPYTSIASGLPLTFEQLLGPVAAPTLTEIEDHRTWHPDPLDWRPQSSRRHTVKLKAHSPRATRGSSPISLFDVPVHVAFEYPKTVSVCVRRHRRREVLFAKGKGGRNRRPKWSKFSAVRC